MGERIFDGSLFSEKLKENRIKGFLLDLDDTLVNTNLWFGRWMKIYVSSIIEKNPNLDYREVIEKLTQTNNEYFKTYAVDKKKLAIDARDLDNFFDTFPIFSKRADLLGQIYKGAPELLDGAIETLNILKNTGLPLALVTHANEKWTNLKVDRRGLREYFKHIEIVEETRFKGPEDWKNGAKAIGVEPSEAVVIGDNLQGDIISSMSIGVKHAVHIESVYSVYRQGVIPEGTIEVKSIKEAIPALMERL